jgi:DHA1 family bicyclomycin/chloramphenicol resistance-like MFS transporter
MKTRVPLWLLILVTVSGTLAMHMFVPAMPAASRSLGASVSMMQMTISIYMVGLATGQLVYGPLSDALGRRPLLLVGLALYTVGSLAAAISYDVYMLLAARLLQALGGCAGIALGRAIARDMSLPEQAVKDLALLNLLVMIGPGLAPLLGSGIAVLFGWRSIFLLLATLGGITLLFIWRSLPETGSPTGSIRISTLRRDYMLLARSPAFLGFALGGACATTSMYAFITAAPFVFVSQLHLSLQEVAFCLGLLTIGVALGNALTRYFIGRVSSGRLVMIGTCISMVSALVLLGIIVSGNMTVFTVTGLAGIFALGGGITSPAAMTRALGVDAKLIGSAAGMYGCLQMAVGAICSSLVGISPNPALASASVLAGAAMLGQAGLWFALRYKPSAQATF